MSYRNSWWKHSPLILRFYHISDGYPQGKIFSLGKQSKFAFKCSKITRTNHIIIILLTIIDIGTYNLEKNNTSIWNSKRFLPAGNLLTIQLFKPPVSAQENIFSCTIPKFCVSFSHIYITYACICACTYTHTHWRPKLFSWTNNLGHLKNFWTENNHLFGK